MTNIILVVVVLAIFIVGIVSPHMAGKIQKKTDNKAGWLKRMSNWLWDPLTWWAKNSIEATRKSIKVVAQWGKKVRWRIGHHNDNS